MIETTYAFEVVCKNMVIEIEKQRCGETYKIQDISVVYFCDGAAERQCVLTAKGKSTLYRCVEVRDAELVCIGIYENEYNRSFDIRGATNERFFIVDAKKEE